MLVSPFGTPFKKALDDAFCVALSPEKENLVPDLHMDLEPDTLAVDEHLPSYVDIEMNPNDFLLSPNCASTVIIAVLLRTNGYRSCC